jgi:UDP-N-acetylglucosamine 2-epimerase
MENIDQDFKNYFKALEEYYEYLKELIKKYKIKPTGNLVRRLAFNLKNNDDVTFSKQAQYHKFITTVVDLKDSLPNS